MILYMAGGYPINGWDPVYGCRWWGSSVDGLYGDTGWGLDASDYTLTANRVSLIYCLSKWDIIHMLEQ